MLEELARLRLWLQANANDDKTKVFKGFIIILKRYLCTIYIIARDVANKYDDDQ